MDKLRKFLAEAFGVMMFVFVIVGAWVILEINQSISSAPLLLPMIIFPTVAALVYCLGNVSGAHLNPAVTFGMYVGGKISGIDTLIYMGGQLLGAVVGSLSLFLFNDFFDMRGYYLFGLNQIMGNSGGYSYIIQTFILEAVLSLLFVYVFLVASGKKGGVKKSSFIVGGTYSALFTLTIFITGGSLNPARALGGTLVDLIFNGSSFSDVSDVWLFIAAPFAGALLASFLYMLFNKNTEAPANDEDNDEAGDEEYNAWDIEEGDDNAGVLTEEVNVEEVPAE